MSHPLAASLLPLLLVSSTPLLGEDLNEIRTRGTLRVLAVIDDEPEFISGAKTGPPGLDYELLDGFARLQRLKLEVVPAVGWDRLVPSLVEGKGDIIAGRFTITDSRKKLIDFTVETFPTRNVVVTRRPHRTIRTLAELGEEKISVIKGTSMAELLPTLGIPAANLDFSIPTGGIPTALRTGRITCTVHEIFTAIVAQRQDPAIQIGLFIGPPMSLGYGVPKQAPQLQKALSEYILNVRRSGTWNRLTVKYFGDAALDILSTLLAGDRNSRLYRRLVYEMQIAQQVTAFHASQRLDGALQVYATARPGHDLNELQRVIDEEVRRLAAEGPTAREVQRVQNQIEAQFLGQMERVGGKADNLNYDNCYVSALDYFEHVLAR